MIRGERRNLALSGFETDRHQNECGNFVASQWRVEYSRKMVHEGLALSELLGAPVVDTSGATVGRVRELAVSPQEDPVRVSLLVVKTRQGDRVLMPAHISSINGGVRSNNYVADWQAFSGQEGFLLLDRDLLDQQIIDVHGRKVVRVNDVDLLADEAGPQFALKIRAVDVGVRGFVRRILKGMVPAQALRALTNQIPPRLIPWEFVDLIEIDPARRVKLKISHEKLSNLHPADIADIVEELSPAEREAVFETLDEGVAAEALEEVEPKLQRSIVESLDEDRAADIVEEMDPDAAADLLGDLTEEKSDAILEEMEPQQREEMEELLEHKENTAAGRMNTEYLAVGPEAVVQDAIAALRMFEGDVSSVVAIYLVDVEWKLVGAVPLQNIVLGLAETKLSEIAPEPLISCKEAAREAEVAELFDKYNLLSLPVVDDEGKLTGVITADDVIALLRDRG
jgi:CBS domain-containing protein/sporulation protein YlmC with PRC-barrel domain